jgi:hypothetical protein
MQQLEPPYRLILDRLSKGQVIPFLGSAASLQPSCPVWDQCVDAALLKKAPEECYQKPKCAGWAPPPSKGLPRASELACHLARLINFPQDESADLARVAQYVDVISGRGNLNERLRSIFNEDYEPSSIHHFLAQIDVPLLIVTTNYDDLIERAFRSNNREYDLVIHTSDPRLGVHIFYVPQGETKPIKAVPNKLNLDLTKRTVIYKMHGGVDRLDSANDQYVITEDDYINFLTRMTKGKVIPSVFAEPFQSRPFLFLGHGLHDWNLRIVLNRLEEEMKKSVKNLVSWAIQYEPSRIEQRFWQKHNVEVFNMRIEDFVRELLAII